MRSSTTLLATAILCTTASFASAQTFTTIDFSANHNLRMQNLDGNAALFPVGSMTFGDVPFDIPTSGYNVWSSSELYSNPSQSGPNPHTLSVSVGIYGADSVYTLINTLWGELSPGSYASIKFLGSGGLEHTVQLDGGIDVRDYRDSLFSNSINGTTTREAFKAGISPFETVRLDEQTFVLPAAFKSATLETIVLSDNGGEFFQRVFLAGITVSAVPEPEAVGAVASIGLLAWGVWRRRAR